MDQAHLVPGLETSRIGFGCGRLVGGASFRESAKLVETALAAGITHFDVAPAYGLGLAEQVIGKVTRDVAGVTIVTKAGIARPPHGLAKSLVRKLAKPFTDRSARLKANLVAANATPASARKRLTADQLRLSFNESLRNLGRSEVAALLLHESPTDIDPTVEAALESLQSEGLLKTFGAGTGDVGQALPLVGSVRQFRWTPQEAEELSTPEKTNIRHGVLRHGVSSLRAALLSPDAQDQKLAQALQVDVEDVTGMSSLMVSMALALDPKGIVLVSSNTPARVRSLAANLNWQAARGIDQAFITAARQVNIILAARSENIPNV